MAERYRWGTREFHQVAVDSDTALAKGDLVKLSSNKGVRCTANTDNLALQYICDQDHPAATAGSVDYVRMIPVKPGAVYEYPLNTATSFAFGATFQISAVQQLTASATNPVAMAVEIGASKTTAKVTFLLPLSLIGDLS